MLKASFVGAALSYMLYDKLSVLIEAPVVKLYLRRRNSAKRTA